MSKILLIDDSQDLREAYQVSLIDEGHDAQTAGNITTALTIVSGWRPDIVVTDIFLGPENGLEFIRRLRSDAPPPIPPVIAISGFPEMASEAIRAGAARFLAKPVELEELLATIEEVLAGRAADRQAGERKRTRHELQVAKAHAAADALVKTLAAGDALVSRRLDVSVRWLSGYFAGSSVALLLQRGDALQVFATSDPRAAPQGSKASGLLEVTGRVLESGASLLLPNLGEQSLIGHSAVGTAKLLAIAPIFTAGLAVGAASLISPNDIGFDGADLELLEQFGRGVGRFIEGGLQTSFFARSGLISRGSFKKMLRNELHTARVRDGELCLMACQTAREPTDCYDLLTSLPLPRTSIGELGRMKVGALIAAGHCRETAQEVRAAVGRELGIRASAELVLGRPLPSMSEDVLIGWANTLLSDAQGTQSLRIDARPTCAS